MKEKISDLIPWVQELSSTLAKPCPNDDQDEIGRRSQLAKFVSCLLFFLLVKLILCYRELEDVGVRSQELSEKGKLARALDKTRDLGEVVKLMERLRQAILIYQVGIQTLSKPEIIDT